jgi:hypothetical protein
LKDKLLANGATQIEVIADIQPRAARGPVFELDRSPQNQDDSWVLPTSWRNAPVQHDGLAWMGIEATKCDEMTFPMGNNPGYAVFVLTAPPDG